MSGSAIGWSSSSSASVGALAYDDELLNLQAAVMPDGLGSRILPSG